MGYGGAPDRIHLIRYPGVDLERFRPSLRAAAREALGLTARRVVFCPRGLGEYLNSDVIVAAVAEVVRRDRDVVFVFTSGASGDSELAKHRELARQLGVAPYCRWEGQVPWELMPRYYAASDVMVSISSNDSLPNCMLEAMACGIPLVMGDIPPIREWIDGDDAAFLVPCRDAAALAAAVCGVFDSEPLARRFAERNLETVRARADARRNNEQIKSLVRRSASAAGRVGGGVNP